MGATFSGKRSRHQIRSDKKKRTQLLLFGVQKIKPNASLVARFGTLFNFLHLFETVSVCCCFFCISFPLYLHLHLSAPMSQIADSKLLGKLPVCAISILLIVCCCTPVGLTGSVASTTNSTAGIVGPLQARQGRGRLWESVQGTRHAHSIPGCAGRHNPGPKNIHASTHMNIRTKIILRTQQPSIGSLKDP